MKKDMLKGNIDEFVHSHVLALSKYFIDNNQRLQSVKVQKQLQANELIENCESYFRYEELENEYISILTEEIYKQAFSDSAYIQKTFFNEVH